MSAETMSAATLPSSLIEPVAWAKRRPWSAVGAPATLAATALVSPCAISDSTALSRPERAIAIFSELTAAP